MDPKHLDELAVRTAAGDKEAFAEIFGLLQKELRLFISAHSSSVDMVDEVLQAAFVVCYQNIAKYEPRGTFISWLKGIARNLLLKELKQCARHVAVEQSVLERIIVQRSLDSAPGADTKIEMVRRLKSCIEKLSASSRDLVEKRYVQRLPIKKLATLFGKSDSWAAMTLLRIRESLRVCMSGRETAT